MIKEIKDLANILNITESNSIELINFYFGNYADRDYKMWGNFPILFFLY
jgi:hypothetical protein